MRQLLGVGLVLLILGSGCVRSHPVVAAKPSASVEPGTLTVDVGHPGVKISPMLYGLMTEEINHSYDGGLYAELIQNRSFKDDKSAPAHWSVVKDGGADATIALDENDPVNR